MSRKNVQWSPLDGHDDGDLGQHMQLSPLPRRSYDDIAEGSRSTSPFSNVSRQETIKCDNTR